MVLRLFLLVIPAFLMFGCVGQNEKQESRIERVNIADLKTPPIQHEQLSDGQLRRIKKLHETFAEVDKSSLETWIDNFKRDLNPDREIAVWERMAKAYKNYTSQKELSPEAKTEVFKTLLMCSMSSDEEDIKSLDLKVLSQEEAKAICKSFNYELPVTVR